VHLNELRKDLKFNRELLSLVETLKNVAGAQYHVMEKEKQRFARFLQSFEEFFRIVDLVAVQNPLVKVSCDTVGLVIVTSDSGFMGGLNQGVVRAAFGAVADVPPERVAVTVIGEKGMSLVGERQPKFFPGVSHETLYERALELKDYLVAEVLSRRIGRVIVVAPRALSFSAQTIDVVNLLPCADLFTRTAEARPAAPATRLKFVAEARDIIIESSFEDIAQYLASLWMTSRLYEILEDGKLAELSARAMHLEGSQQKVEKEFKRIKHLCFKAAHELIDKGMRESYGAKSGKRKRERRSEAA
jgi:ATP synthase F1 gamma subunit